MSVDPNDIAGFVSNCPDPGYLTMLWDQVGERVKTLTGRHPAVPMLAAQANTLTPQERQTINQRLAETAPGGESPKAWQTNPAAGNFPRGTETHERQYQSGFAAHTHDVDPPGTMYDLPGGGQNMPKGAWDGSVPGDRMTAPAPAGQPQAQSQAESAGTLSECRGADEVIGEKLAEMKAWLAGKFKELGCADDVPVPGDDRPSVDEFIPPDPPTEAEKGQ